MVVFSVKCKIFSVNLNLLYSRKKLGILKKIGKKGGVFMMNIEKANRLFKKMKKTLQNG